MDLNALIARQKSMLEKRIKTPLEVEVVLADHVVTVVMPLMMPGAFFDLSTAFPASSAQELRRFGFGLEEVARHYPDIVIRDGDEEDNLLSVAVDGKDKEIHYGWPEVYDVRDYDDRQSIRAAIWGEYVYRPQQARTAPLGRDRAHCHSEVAVVQGDCRRGRSVPQGRRVVGGSRRPRARGPVPGRG
ncbi:hypothetical protein ACTJI8_02885 [Microbacterium sp. 22303]|uniref:hypothetical protein n=1 Tax=Microbacterium sp. 22303 TaxID=3453905 RepID=UPI003F847786